uniref:Uncharacterized protein n=1 Tax=Arundo donax TaxID=35708 RepID=A0A0A9FGE5_ARUDO
MHTQMYWKICSHAGSAFCYVGWRLLWSTVSKLCEQRAAMRHPGLCPAALLC